MPANAYKELRASHCKRFSKLWISLTGPPATEERRKIALEGILSSASIREVPLALGVNEVNLEENEKVAAAGSS